MMHDESFQAELELLSPWQEHLPLDQEAALPC